jgi:hypothetical protein
MPRRGAGGDVVQRRSRAGRAVVGRGAGVATWAVSHRLDNGLLTDGTRLCLRLRVEGPTIVLDVDLAEEYRGLDADVA